MRPHVVKTTVIDHRAPRSRKRLETRPKSRVRNQRLIHLLPQPFRHAGAVGDLLVYASVITTEQKAHLQTDALKAAGCVRVWTDKASGALDHRPQLDRVPITCDPVTRLPTDRTGGLTVLRRDECELGELVRINAAVGVDDRSVEDELHVPRCRCDDRSGRIGFDLNAEHVFASAVTGVWLTGRRVARVYGSHRRLGRDRARSRFGPPGL